jgi:hypothetical protein
MNNQEVTEILIGYPKSTEDIKLHLQLGACRLKAAPSDTPHWLEGHYEHLENALPPKLDQNGGTVKLSQDFGGIRLRGWTQPPTFHLGIGRSKPFSLVVEGGAAEMNYDLGGLPLRGLVVKQGAGSFDFDFSAPNPESIGLMTVEVGAGALKLRNLLNANFSRLKMTGGAAEYKFDLGGQLRQHAEMDLDIGLASMELHIPASLAVKIIPDTTLASVEMGDGFTKKDGAYWSQAAMAGPSYLLTIKANIALGSLEVKTI